MFLVAQAIDQRIKQKSKAYNWITDLLDIFQNKLKDEEKTQIIVFRIKIDT